jgi:hypothetical protein
MEIKHYRRYLQLEPLYLNINVFIGYFSDDELVAFNIKIRSLISPKIIICLMGLKKII